MNRTNPNKSRLAKITKTIGCSISTIRKQNSISFEGFAIAIQASQEREGSKRKVDKMNETEDFENE